MVAQPPQQAIEDGEPQGIAMQDRRLRAFDEFAGYVEGTAWRFKQKWFGRFGRVALHAPCHLGRFHVVQRQHPRGFAPAIEIGFAFEGDGVH